PEILLLLRQFPRQAFLLGDVPRDISDADDRARVIADRRYGSRDVDPAAVLREANGLEMFDALAGTHPRQDHLFLGMPLPRDENLDWPPDEFGRFVAENPASALVARRYDAVQVLRDDRIGRRGD